MALSRRYTASIEAQAKAAMRYNPEPSPSPQICAIAEDILLMDNAELAKALTHARRSCKVMPDRLRQLQAEWTKRLAALDD
jgi:hypothetical protein